MSKPIIEVESLAKRYRLGTLGAKSLREAAENLWHQAAGRRLQQESGELWALKNVSFSVNEGEVVGIIGRNGAGKSTLLKILSRITEPTSGRAILRGRVASLLEVGTGFHPELTGRENIYLNGAILGMRKREIAAKFDEIVAFAEIEKFVDTPVKHYSSGMYVRLAFAVAAHLEPEILLIDEVLAVGDLSFQKKCLGKMGDIARTGRTIFFVSHNMAAVRTLCSKSVYMDNGRTLQCAATSDVIAQYLKLNGSYLKLENIWQETQSAPGDHLVKLHSVRIIPEDMPLTVNNSLKIEITYLNSDVHSTLNASIVLYNSENVCIFNSTSEPKKFKKGLITSICRIPGNFLNNDCYRIRLLLVRQAQIPIFDLDNVASFEVHDTVRTGWQGRWVGVVRPQLEWTDIWTEAINVGR